MYKRQLRAWALETHLRREISERFGADWFERPEAGRFLVDLWRAGQRDDADTLLRDLNGSRLDFSAMLADLGLVEP